METDTFGPAGPRGDAALRVLLIEDDAEDAAVLRLRLPACAPAGTRLELAEAASLNKGLSALAAGDFGLVLLDLHLPDGRGLDVLRRLRERAPQVPVAVITALNDDGVRRSALRQGACGYILKGALGPKDLRRALSAALQRLNAGSAS